MATSYMLPISKIKEGINKGIQEDRGRATHGDTSLNAFFIDELGKVYPWRRRGDLPLGRDAYFDSGGKHHKRFNPGAVMVHSHAAENWAHFEQMTGGIEPMTSFSVSDIQFLQGMVRKNTGNTLALIHGDGRLELLRVPELGTDWILGLDAAKIALQASPPENWLDIRKHKHDTWEDVHKRVVKDFAKRNKLIYKDGLRWKPPGKVVEPLIKRRAYYPRPKHPWYEMIWEETSTPSPGVTATTKPYWMIVPGAAWPAEAKQMELWRERPGGRARQTYKRVPWTEAERPWEEAQQMRFFGGLGDLPVDPELPSELQWTIEKARPPEPGGSWTFAARLPKSMHSRLKHWLVTETEKCRAGRPCVPVVPGRLDEFILDRPYGRIRVIFSPDSLLTRVAVSEYQTSFGLGAAPAFRLTREAWQPSFELPRPGKPKPAPGVRIKPKIRKADLTADEKKAIDAIGEGSVHIDDVGRKSGLPPYKVSAALVMLELKGLVQQTAGKMFHTKKQPSPSTLSGKIKPLTAKELRESGFSEEAIKMMLEKQSVAARLRKLQDQLIRSLMAKHGKRADVEDIPVEAGLPSIAQLRAYVFPQHEEAFTWLLKRLKRKGGGFEGVFGGRIAHCGIWDRDKYTGDLICKQYFTACQTTDRCLNIPEKPKTQARVCVKFKDVPSITTAKGYVSRCAHYEALCRPVGCIRSAAPHPEPAAFDPKEVRAVAEWMLDEVKERAKIDPKYLAREIKSRGGIKAYRKQYPGQKTDQEYMSLPLHLKSKKGLAPDEMAAEMGYGSDTELYRDIHAAYPPKTPRTPLQKQLAKQKPTWRDYEEGARDYLMERAGAGIYT